MAIKINAGAAPTLGRLTMPKGTFLNSPQPAFSNPATSAAGGLGAGAGAQPAQAGLIGQFGDEPPKDGATLRALTWEEQFWNPRSLGEFGRGVKGLFDNIGQPQAHTQNFYNAAGVPIQGYENTSVWNGKEETTYNPVAYDYRGNRFTWDADQNKYIRDETGALNPTKTTSSPSNDLVGRDIGTAPNQMTASSVLQMYPNLTPSQVAEVMRSKGYESRYLPGVGGIWTKTGAATASATSNGLLGGSSGGATSSETDDRGRPVWVDPTQLERGERVTSASGLSYVGGTPTADGKAQYAVTIPQGRAVANDKHGDYKWESSVKKDDDGNWVRVYYKKLRKVRTAKGRRKIAQRGAQQPTPQEMNDAEALVTLRANYG